MFNVFSALSRLANAANAFADALTEATSRFRQSVLSDTDSHALPPVSEAMEEEGEAKVARNGKKTTATR